MNVEELIKFLNDERYHAELSKDSVIDEGVHGYYTGKIKMINDVLDKLKSLRSSDYNVW